MTADCMKSSDKSVSALTKDIRQDTKAIRVDATEIRDDTSQILAEIARLRRLIAQGDLAGGGSNFVLQRYLDDLTSYAESVADDSSDKDDLVISAQR